MTGTKGPKVSSWQHSMSVVTSASSVGSTKAPSRRFPPLSSLAPRDTASETCWTTWRETDPQATVQTHGCLCHFTLSAARGLMSGPWVVSGSQPWPKRSSASIARPNFSTKRSWTAL